MARDTEPMTEAEFEALRAAMEEQREALHEALAEDLGGDPEDYRVDTEPVPDGGEAGGTGQISSERSTNADGD